MYVYEKSNLKTKTTYKYLEDDIQDCVVFYRLKMMINMFFQKNAYKDKSSQN